jgi:hypothetical protein
MVDRCSGASPSGRPEQIATLPIIGTQHQRGTDRVSDDIQTGARRPDVRDIYPLSPMQQGILFHTLRAERSGPYVEQFVFDAVGPIDAHRLATAWDTVVNRHATLRTAFVWEGVDQPVQAVVDRCAIPLAEIDLTGRSADEVTASLDEFLGADRDRGFLLTEVPLMRLTVLRHDSGAIVVWTLHHLVMDGWSMPITVNEVASAYRAGGTGDFSAPAGQFRDFIDWLTTQDHTGTERFWAARLAGVRPTRTDPLRPGRRRERRGSAAAGRGYHDLSPELSAELVAAARSSRVTLSTLFQAAWGLLLSRHTDSTEVTFGTTVSGRPTELPGVAEIVGVFINTIPHRMTIDPEASPRQWLCAVQRDHLDAVPFQHLGLLAIQSSAGLPAGTALFDSILVFENYPSENPYFEFGDGARLVVREVIEDAGYPLTLTVLPRHPSIRLQLLYDQALFDDETIRTLLGRFDFLLQSFVDNLTGRVGAIEVCAADQTDPVAGRGWAEVELPDSVTAPGSAPTADTPVFVRDAAGGLALIGVPGAIHLGPRDNWRDTGRRGCLLADGRVELLTEVTPTDAPDSFDTDELFRRPAARLLRSLWTEILDRPVTSANADFLRLGGDSLTAVRLTGRLRLAFDSKVLVNDVLDARTLGSLLRLLDDQLGSADEVDRLARAATEGNAD